MSLMNMFFCPIFSAGFMQGSETFLVRQVFFTNITLYSSLDSHIRALHHSPSFLKVSACACV